MGSGLIEDFVGGGVVLAKVHLVAYIERIDVLLQGSALAVRTSVQRNPIQSGPVDALRGQLVLQSLPVGSLGVIGLAGDGILALLQQDAVVDASDVSQLTERGIGVSLEQGLQGIFKLIIGSHNVLLSI